MIFDRPATINSYGKFQLLIILNFVKICVIHELEGVDVSAAFRVIVFGNTARSSRLVFQSHDDLNTRVNSLMNYEQLARVHAVIVCENSF